MFVFLFFGVVAVTGTFFAQSEELTWESFVLAVRSACWPRRS